VDESMKMAWEVEMEKHIAIEKENVEGSA